MRLLKRFITSMVLCVSIGVLSSCTSNTPSSSIAPAPAVQYTQEDPYRSIMNDLTPQGSNVSSWTDGVLEFTSNLSFDNLVSFYQSKLTEFNMQGNETTDLNSLREFADFSSDTFDPSRAVNFWAFIGKYNKLDIVISVMNANDNVAREVRVLIS